MPPPFRYRSETTIAAPPETVWRILTDPHRLATPEFGILALSGAIRPGGRLRLRSAAAPTSTFRLRVDTVDRPREMVWVGGMPFGLFTGRRVFTLTPAAGATRFVLQEDYTGALAARIFPKIPDLSASFQTFAVGLKATSERELAA
ncbi:MAG: SRPBCC domain-containing protein [Pseudomonadota bacterium]